MFMKSVSPAIIHISKAKDGEDKVPYSTNRRGRRRSPQMVFGATALLLTLVLGGLFYFWLGWNLYWIWLIVCNLVTFVYFRFDKRQAQQAGGARVPEIVLHGLALAGGFIGGWVGMFVRPRHKVQKAIFWIVLSVATLLHGGLIYWVIGGFD